MSQSPQQSPQHIESGPGPWIKKAWGYCRTLFCDCHVEIIECDIVAGGFSSIHKHMDKDNAFHVISGELEVIVYPGSLRPTTYCLRTEVQPGENSDLTIPPRVPHKFRAVQATRLIEVYRAQNGVPLRPGDGDICRTSDGGVRGK